MPTQALQQLAEWRRIIPNTVQHLSTPSVSAAALTAPDTADIAAAATATAAAPGVTSAHRSALPTPAVNVWAETLFVAAEGGKVQFWSVDR